MSIFAKQGKKRIVKILIVNILISLLLIIIFDVTMFNFLPSQYVYKFKEYRQISIPGIGSRSIYSKEYYIKHDKRGFDIGKNKSGRHWFSELKYSIWSNSFGCFDTLLYGYGKDFEPDDHGPHCPVSLIESLRDALATRALEALAARALEGE